LERLWSEKPVSALICNNLAWCYALAGRELDRAKELVDAAIILADDPSVSRKTLGAIHARRSEWQETRAIFSDLREADDRPNNQALNDYFIGLCDYSLGSKQDAITRWRRALELPHVEIRWRKAIDKSLKIAQEGGTVTDPIFASDAEGSP
jgi:tetratricopeptide (TPR) repeat protein